MAKLASGLQVVCLRVWACRLACAPAADGRRRPAADARWALHGGWPHRARGAARPCRQCATAALPAPGHQPSRAGSRKSRQRTQGGSSASCATEGAAAGVAGAPARCRHTSPVQKSDASFMSICGGGEGRAGDAKKHVGVKLRVTASDSQLSQQLLAAHPNAVPGDEGVVLLQQLSKVVAGPRIKKIREVAGPRPDLPGAARQGGRAGRG